MRVDVAHISLEFKDSNTQHTADIEKLFRMAQDRKLAWITGTEAGPGARNTGPELVALSEKYGYTAWVPSAQPEKGKGGQSTDAWVAVRNDFMAGDLEVDFRPAIPGAAVLREKFGVKTGRKKWAPKGLVSVGFDNPELGRINVGAAHYLTGARDPKSPYWEWNQKLADEIGAWASEVGKGQGLAFYGGDQNMSDNKNDEPQGDTFMGNPLTSLWDELQVWRGSGHGNIDVIASYNKDKRVVGRSIRALNDEKFRLNTDHFLLLASFDIEPATVTEPLPTQHACPLCEKLHIGVVQVPVS